jgi:hypothetical protein
MSNETKSSAKRVRDLLSIRQEGRVGSTHDQGRPPGRRFFSQFGYVRKSDAPRAQQFGFATFAPVLQDGGEAADVARSLLIDELSGFEGQRRKALLDFLADPALRATPMLKTPKLQRLASDALNVFCVWRWM